MRLATEAGDAETAVTAYRELGFVDVQAGRRQTAEAWLARAEALAETDVQLGAVLGIRGMNASDMGDYPAAFQHLQGSVERSGRGGDPRQQAFSLSILARAHLLRDERSQAAVALADSLELVRAERWMAFLPWPEALKGELDLRTGHVEAATEQLEHAWALATHLGDPCWEGMAARGLGLLSAARGDHPGATAWLAEARTRCNRTSDRYQWVSAHVLDAVIGIAIDQDDEPEAARLVDALATLAARGDMRELVVRAHDPPQPPRRPLGPGHRPHAGHQHRQPRPGPAPQRPPVGEPTDRPSRPGRRCLPTMSSEVRSGLADLLGLRLLELPVAHAGQEGLPLVGVEAQHRTVAVLGVANGDLGRVEGDLDTAVGAAAAALAPHRARQVHDQLLSDSSSWDWMLPRVRMDSPGFCAAARR